MWFAIIGEDHPNILDVRLRVREAHLARVAVLQSEGRVLLAGPMLQQADDAQAGMFGSVMIVDFPSLAAAQAWIDKDPYCVQGVFKRVIVQPFLKVFPHA